MSIEMIDRRGYVRCLKTLSLHADISQIPEGKVFVTEVRSPFAKFRGFVFHGKTPGLAQERWEVKYFALFNAATQRS
jgi:hypothetical protein